MPEMLGMNPEQVRALARQMETAASEIEETVSRLSGELQSAQWHGNDATQFREEWESHHAPAMRTAAEALENTATIAERNAAEQEETSARL